MYYRRPTPVRFSCVALRSVTMRLASLHDVTMGRRVNAEIIWTVPIFLMCGILTGRLGLLLRERDFLKKKTKKTMLYKIFTFTFINIFRPHHPHRKIMVDGELR